MLRVLVIILVLSSLGLLVPAAMSQLATYIPIFLAVVMFSMGITLVLDDFIRAAEKWRLILLGTVLQFILMPFIAWGLSKAFVLTLPLTIGMVLVGCAPGGTSSNVMVFLGKGNVPLSISLTVVSTMLSPFITPILIQFWLGETVSFDAYLVFLSIAKIVIAPVVLGMIINRITERFSLIYIRYAAIISALSIGLIIGAVLAINKELLTNNFPLIIFLAVVIHNGLGYGLGYLGAFLVTEDRKDARTIAIEVGMQNSGLSVTLAQQFFSQYATTSLPGAIFSFWHNLSGLILTYFFGRKNQTSSE